MSVTDCQQSILWLACKRQCSMLRELQCKHGGKQRLLLHANNLKHRKQDSLWIHVLPFGVHYSGMDKLRHHVSL